MSPEFGATATLFPIDEETLAYLRLTGRSPDRVALVERYAKEQGLWREPGDGPAFDEALVLDLATVEPSVAGPRRPQDRVPLPALPDNFRTNFPDGLEAPVDIEGDERVRPEGGVVDAASDESFPASDPTAFGAGDAAEPGSPPAEPVVAGAPPVDRRAYRPIEISVGDQTTSIRTGSVAIAAITSCTNTSNPTVMIGAGLLARNAVARGLHVPPTVKTSLAPGSKAVTGYLEAAGLMAPLGALGFALAGYGCTTCIGNSGPLDSAVAAAIEANDLVVAAVLSGNRNFEGRIHPLARASYLASPPLVVAFALAGRIDIDLSTEPLGTGSDGRPVHLADIWPSPDEIRAVIAEAIDPELFRRTYAVVFEGDERWRALPIPSGDRYAWDPVSTYVAKPPFFDGLTFEGRALADIVNARALVVLGDSVTTDHISPAGSIAPWSPAGQWLQERGVTPLEFNSYGARRGHHEVMMRGTFGNIRLRNRLAEGREGPYTVHLPSGEEAFIFDAARRYAAEGVPLVVLAGREYGSGSSRDWAAKGTSLLGVRAVIAESYERIHRSNLVGMGVLPLQFRPGDSAASLGLTGRETFTVPGLAEGLTPRQSVTVVAERDLAAGGDGESIRFEAIARLDGPIEVDYYRAGGILPAVLRRLAGAS
jgi:aconitate hydratase